jgi:hypothetical protein
MSGQLCPERADKVRCRHAGHDPDRHDRRRAGATHRKHAVGLFGRGERTSQEQPSSDSVKRAAEAQERYYLTWRYGDTPAQAPAQPSRQSGRLVLAIGVLAAALALLSVLAAMFAFASSCRSGR